MDFCDIASFC
ncbi:unnamed protein product [Spirodela intermedia]|uniref:Uncharacterized protein n=1 Tax=Spirodela intermedia TaxID=51605 RepID=A0A7I8KQC4_SPIIN|nr:unnamed protein product [Spirodela intermedia]